MIYFFLNLSICMYILYSVVISVELVNGFICISICCILRIKRYKDTHYIV